MSRNLKTSSLSSKSAESLFSLSMPIKYNTNNLLLKSITPLLGEIIFLSSIPPEVDIKKIHVSWIKKIQNFEQILLQEAYDLETILAARYCLCTFLDEFVLTQEWGIHSCWSEQTLLSLFYNETSGGEKFYFILKKMSENPQKNFYFLHFIYVLLCLGYKGHLYNKDPDLIQTFQQKIFQKIYPFLKNFKHLSPRLVLLGDFASKKLMPVWPILTLFGALFLLSEALFELKIQRLEESIENIIQSYEGHL